MDSQTSARLLRIILGLGLLAGAGGMAFWIGTMLNSSSSAESGHGREATSGEEAEGGASPETTPVAEPDHRDQAVEAEQAEPSFAGVINGIDVGIEKNPIPPEGVCTNGEYKDARIEAAAGTELYFEATYLPPGASPTSDIAVICDGLAVSVGREWSLDVPGIGAGLLSVTRFLSQNHPFAFDGSEARFDQAIIDGKNAVTARPVIPDEGYGPAGVAIAEEWGMTIVFSINLTLEELIQVAEGLE